VTEYERERKKLIKAVRSTVRLKHSLAADDELYDVLPQILGEFDKAIASGKPYELATLSLLSEVDGAA
jgi:hypothetical protein